MPGVAVQSSPHAEQQTGHMLSKSVLQPAMNTTPPYDAVHWKEWLKEITEQDIWKAAQFAQNLLSDGSQTCILTLYTKTASNNITATHGTVEQKAAVLKTVFFPPRPHHLPPYSGDSDPPPTPLPFSTLPLSIFHHCINKLHPHKAPGPDGIPNVVLKYAAAILAPLLHKCLQATLSL